MVNAADGASVHALTKSAAKIVEGLLGSRVIVAELLQQGMMTFKCRVRTVRDDDVIVRFYPSSRSAVVQQEPDLLMRCRRAGFSVPQPIGDSRTGPSAPLNYVVYRYIEGATMAVRLSELDDARRNVLAQDLARHLYRLHELEFDGAGELATGWTARDASWASFVSDSMSAGLLAVRRRQLLEPTVADEIERVMRAGPPALPCVTGRLVWGDINFGNILVEDDGSIAGLIDFEGCLSGDPMATLGYAAAVHGTDPFFVRLAQAWPLTLTEEQTALVDWYALLRALRLAPYVHLPLPTGRPRDPLISIVPGMIPALRRLAAIS
ncbi:phosphotransferase family protein [Burkholderia multivorans]|uniref:phosphotransferase family protein n=1 Tax=Burkholderia multivorans TaxID=87883 RepID=UPI001C22898A|nr:phosphotransferase [Burkholderia multivorans]MBU9224075.1 phosphotransferase [Burkholderia multivorans]MBU9419880.1 phosphotransferase [Burkholderia multivorans]MBU9479720.1 phosphotransferase [Burkholderia multivorans]